MKFLLLFSLWLGTSFSLYVSASNPTPESTEANRLWTSGIGLQAQKKYLPAILEYNRLLYHFPEFTSKNLVYLRIGQCYDSIQQTGQAHRFYEEALQATPKGEALVQWLLLLNARILIAQGKFAMAMAELYSLDTLNLSRDQHDIYHLFAAVALHQLGSTSQCARHLAILDVEPGQIVNYERSVSAARRPNSNVAMILSAILPGAGQLYSGAGQEALNSILINALFLTATLRTAQFAQTIDVVIALLPWFQRYYVGGYNRASVLAHQKQLKKKTQALGLVIKYIPDSRIHAFQEENFMK